MAAGLSMQTYTNPIIDVDMPDPGVLKDGDVYWMTHTMGRVPACPLWKSVDLIHWKFQTHMLTAENAPSWVHDRFWAPELHKVGKRYILLYTAGDVHGHLCIGSAIAANPEGPYKTFDRPLIDGSSMGVIDPTLFQDDNGRVYVFWKTDGNDVGKPCQIFVQEMAPGDPGVAFAPGSVPSLLMTSQPHGWENGIIEGPELVKRNGWYYLFYSGSGFSSSYAEGVARSRHITGPYERCPANPLLKSNDTWVNPGHGAFVNDAHGDCWHYYHAYHARDHAHGRVQLLDRVYFDSPNDWPRIGGAGTPGTLASPGPQVKSAR
jgi:beta-xylosidase